MSKPLDALTPIHYLAQVLMAEDRRKELGLPENAQVTTTLWLVTRDDLRAAAVRKAEQWALTSFGSVAAAERAVATTPSFVNWKANEEAQAAARGDR